MRSLKRSARVRDQRGLTALELLIGVTLLSVLTAAAFAMLAATQDRVRYTSRSTESLDGARTTLNRIAREVRDGAGIYEDADCPVTTCLTVAVVPPGGGSVVDVRYRFDDPASTLFRQEGARDPISGDFAPSSAEVPVVGSLVNDTNTPVFCRLAPCTTPSETGAVQVTLVVNADPKRPAQGVTLTSYVTPRNL